MSVSQRGAGRPAIGSPVLVRLENLAALDDYAQQHGMSRAEAVRVAVRRLLAANERANRKPRAKEITVRWAEFDGQFVRVFTTDKITGEHVEEDSLAAAVGSKREATQFLAGCDVELTGAWRLNDDGNFMRPARH